MTRIHPPPRTAGTTLIDTPLTLPACKISLKNRFAKASMSEGLAEISGRPTSRLEALYRA